MKKLAKIVGALLALVIVAIIAVPLLVPADTLKELVAKELSKATGRTLTIEGDASLKIFPDIAVALEKVSLGNPAGEFKSDRMFYAGRLSTGVKLVPLLSKEIIITGVTLEDAEINLEETKAGQKNWEFASKASSDTQQEKKEDAASEKKPASRFAIGDIAVKNSSVNFTPATGKPISASDINITLSGADGASPLVLDGSVTYQGKPVKLALDVKDSKAFLNGTGNSPVVADIVLPGGTLNFSGTAEKKDEIGAKGTLKLDVSALPALLEWATGKPAAPATPKKVSFNGPLELAGKKISFSSIDAKLDSLTIGGRLNADLTGSVPAIAGALKLGVIDLDAFTQASGAKTQTGAAAPKAAASEGWSRDPIDLSGLKAVNAKLGLAIDGVKKGALEVGKGAMDVNLNNGALKLGIDSLAIYGGNARGSLGASPAGISTDLDLSGIQIEPLLTALTGKSLLTGSGAVALNLKGNGNSQHAIVSSLAGTMKATLRDGKLKGVNIGELLRNVKQGKFYADDSQATDFAELGGSWNFAGGVGRNEDLAMKAPILRMTGKGSVNLPARTLDYRLLPTLVTSLKGQDGKDKQGVTVPLIITGPWSKLSITPDLAGMIEEGIKNPEALKENLKGLKEGIKDFNSPKDIGKALFGGSAAKEGATTEGAAPSSSERKQQAIENLIKGFGN